MTLDFFQVLQQGLQDTEGKYLKRKWKNEKRIQIKYFVYHTTNKYELRHYKT